MVVHTQSSYGIFASTRSVVAFVALVSFVLLLGVASPVPAQTLSSVPGRAAVVAPASEDALRFSSEGLTQIALPGGGVAVDLEGRFKHYLVAHTGPDGKLHVGCTQDPDGLHSHTSTDIKEAE